MLPEYMKECYSKRRPPNTVDLTQLYKKPKKLTNDCVEKIVLRKELITIVEKMNNIGKMLQV